MLYSYTIILYYIILHYCYITLSTNLLCLANRAVAWRHLQRWYACCCCVDAVVLATHHVTRAPASRGHHRAVWRCYIEPARSAVFPRPLHSSELFYTQTVTHNRRSWAACSFKE